MNFILIGKCIVVDTDVVNGVTRSRQSVITRVIILFLWHDVIHWITATSYDRSTTYMGSKAPTGPNIYYDNNDDNNNNNKEIIIILILMFEFVQTVYSD